jgi:hypothetical protein
VSRAPFTRDTVRAEERRRAEKAAGRELTGAEVDASIKSRWETWFDAERADIARIKRAGEGLDRATRAK